MSPHLARDIQSQQTGLPRRDRYSRGGHRRGVSHCARSGGTISFLSRLRRAGGTRTTGGLLSWARPWASAVGAAGGLVPAAGEKGWVA